MNDLTIGLLSALLATNQPQAVSNLVQQQTGISVEVDNARDPEETELRQLMMADIQSKAAYQGALVQAEATKQANADQFFGQTQVTSDGVTF